MQPLSSLGRSRQISSVAVVIIFGFLATPGISQGTQSSSIGPKPEEIVQFLTQTVGWYHQTQQERYVATTPSDLASFADARRIADQIVKVAFGFARQEDQRQAKRASATAPTDATKGLSQYENLARISATTDDVVNRTRTEVESLKAELDKTPASKRRKIDSQLSETESELDLFQARQQALHSMLEFMGGASAIGNGGLRAQIEELARSVPAALTNGSNSDATPASNEQSLVKAGDTSGAPPGIWALTSDLFRLSSKRQSLANVMSATDALGQSAKQLRAPMGSYLKQLIQQGNQLANAADTSDSSQLADQKQKLDSLTTQFKEVSTAMTPLSKQAILLDLYKRNLANWQADVSTEFKQKAKTLIAKLLGLLGVLGAVLIIGEVWRRAIFRYVHDLRRRHQFLLMRKIILWFAVAVVLMFTFVTELGAVATFAGLITAGVAVALQNVIVSIVGYFFLIGKYGIRVGDRVQIGSVTGEVVEIGLVRFHLMELSSTEAGSEPTGRVVAFSNSVVFQSTAGLFKQIPGTDFIWHQISLEFSPENSYAKIRERMEQAVNVAFADYHDSLERQRMQMETNITSISPAELKPRVRVHFTASAIEGVVRFPVVAAKAGEIDGRIMSELFAAINREPKLRLTGSAVPIVRTEAEAAAKT